MSSSDKRFIIVNFSKFVEQLRAQDKLPALVFRYDPLNCSSSNYTCCHFLRRYFVFLSFFGPIIRLKYWEKFQTLECHLYSPVIL